ncbi:alpha-ketoglutarate-dependent dioxygenase AlkB family protein [Xanthomonas sacchari]|uniref:alpha-ketoglutarate-dependent dioxygenase AlkB family protein n=1 Tax=Xanthomonas sacchari TaxID=56458 RepID=UPI0024352839|nr:alpha-ketoglutarate-dependent dioxygenase AlkB [Xanthomonas sacchari]
MELDLPGADLRWYPEWLDPAVAAALCAQLLQDVTWEVHSIRLFGKLVDSPRLSCWIGDADASYRYSGTLFAPHPWPAALLPLRARLAAETGVAFNSVLANRYRDGRDAMGWHSDDERELGPTPMIASLSLGATRRFVLRHRQQPALRQALELTSGGLLLMAGDTQRLYRHALPRTAKPVGERINLTFRRIV